jgi:hypothetical protein
LHQGSQAEVSGVVVQALHLGGVVQALALALALVPIQRKNESFSVARKIDIFSLEFVGSNANDDANANCMLCLSHLSALADSLR